MKINCSAKRISLVDGEFVTEDLSDEFARVVREACPECSVSSVEDAPSCEGCDCKNELEEASALFRSSWENYENVLNFGIETMVEQKKHLIAALDEVNRVLRLKAEHDKLVSEVDSLSKELKYKLELM